MRWMALLFTLPSLVMLRSFNDSSVCSPVGIPISRSSDDVFFIGSALPDTVLTGPGSTLHRLGEGHSGIGKRRTIYGQLMRVEKVQGISAIRLPPGTSQVVLVPWDYGPDCRTVIWGSSARWVTPGTRGVYEATLRPRKHWAQGIPTLDVSRPDFTPYPSAARIGRQWRDITAEWLSIDEALDLFERLPSDSALTATPLGAAEPLEAWARSNPSLARRDPARMILRLVLGGVNEARLPSIRFPLSGTYRFVISIPHVDSLVLYARTEDRAWSALDDRYAPGTREDTEYYGAMIGYRVLAAFATAPSDLPRRSSIEETSPSMAIGLAPIVDHPDSVLWRGGVSFDGTNQDFAFWYRAIRPRSDSIHAAMPRDWYYIPGFWTLYRDGTVRYRHSLERHGVTLLSVVGERVSDQILTPRAKRD